MNLLTYILHRKDIEQQLIDYEIQITRTQIEREKQRELKNKYYKELKKMKEEMNDDTRTKRKTKRIFKKMATK